jgi:hypothetical protein
MTSPFTDADVRASAEAVARYWDKAWPPSAEETARIVLDTLAERYGFEVRQRLSVVGPTMRRIVGEWQEDTDAD